MNKKNSSGYLFVLAAAVLWSLSGVLIKTVSASAIWISLIRSVVASLLLLPFFLKRKIEPVKSLAITGVWYFIFISSFTLTTKIGSSAMAVAMQYSAPIYLMAYEAVKEKKIQFRKIPIFVLFLIGILLCVLDGLNSASLFSIFTGIIIGISFLLYSINLKNIKSGSALGIVGGVNLVAVPFFLAVLPLDFRPVPNGLSSIIPIVLAGIFISAVSYAIYGEGLKKIPVESALIIAMAEPLLNPIWVYLATKYIPPLFTMLGLLFILMGVCISIYLPSNQVNEKEE